VNAEDRALADRFLDMMAAESGASRHTLAAYRNDLERAAESLGSLASASSEGLSGLGARWSDLAP
jgi:integrase/recombinase XerD